MRTTEGTTSQILDTLSAIAVAPVGIAGAYLGALSLLGTSKRTRNPSTDSTFVIVVPAHNESLSIGATVTSLQRIDYPASQFRIVVVADNCTDNTAALAAESGAEVIVRSDVSQRGKGYALALAFEHMLAGPDAPDAFVVVDADTVVTPNILQAFAGALGEGEQVLQATYHVANDDATWRTTLMAIAFTCIHDVRSNGRERLRLSTGLRGNGMCFSAQALRQVPHHAASLVEDVEYGLDLAEHGIRVAYVHEAVVKAEMPERAEESESQRKRWERGRAKLRRERGPKLLADAVRRGDVVRADIAADLLIPPLATLSVGLGAGALAVSGARLLSTRWPARAGSLVAVGIGGLGVHVASGWQQSGTGAAGLRAFAQVPQYVLWKLRIGGSRVAGGSGAKTSGKNSKKGLGNPSSDAEEWVRTTRNAERPTGSVDQSADR